MVTRSEYLRPHFEVPSLLVDTTIDMDRVKLCAEEDGLCDLEEMSLMLQQLVDLDDECSSPRKQKNPECDLNAKAKRDMFMDELGFLMERAEHLNDHEQEEKRNQGMSDSLAYRLARFHEIAEFEEH